MLHIRDIQERCKPGTVPENSPPVAYLLAYGYLWTREPLWLIGITRIDPRIDPRGALAEAVQMVRSSRAEHGVQDAQIDLVAA